VAQPRETKPARKRILSVDGRKKIRSKAVLARAARARGWARRTGGCLRRRIAALLNGLGGLFTTRKGYSEPSQGYGEKERTHEACPAASSRKESQSAYRYRTKGKENRERVSQDLSSEKKSADKKEKKGGCLSQTKNSWSKKRKKDVLLSLIFGRRLPLSPLIRGNARGV